MMSHFKITCKVVLRLIFFFLKWPKEGHFPELYIFINIDKYTSIFHEVLVGCETLLH